MYFNKLRLSLAPFLVACVLLPALPATAELGGIMIVTSARQGEINGPAKLNGKEGIPILSVSTATAPSRDTPTGLASGRRQQRPVTIVKEIDAASPKLMQALKTHELLQVMIEFHPQAKSPERLNLTNATVANFRTVKQGNKEVEEIELIYEKIEWTFAGGKKTVSDDWHQ